jgi:hypothetical protein
MTVADRSVSPAYDAPPSSEGGIADDEPPGRWTTTNLVMIALASIAVGC